MDLRVVFLGWFLCGLCVTVQSETTLSYAGSSLFPMKEDATLSCLFNIPNSDVNDVQAAWWQTKDSSSVKIGISRFDPNDSFTYPTAPSNIELSSDRFATGFADLTILNISVSDVAEYECEIEDQTLLETKRIGFSIDVFNIPTVTIKGVEIALDIRPVPEQPESPTENSNTAAEDNTEGGDEQPTGSDQPEETTAPASNEEEDDPTVTIVRCDVTNAYPMPSKINFYGISQQLDKEWSIPQSEFEETKQTNVDGTFNVSARLRIIPTASLDKAVFSCSAFITSEDKEVISDELSPIEVKHNPSAVRTIISPSSTVDEFTQVTVSCNSDGNPSPMKYLQLPNDDKVEATDGYNFLATRDSIGTYNCMLMDADGVLLFDDPKDLVVNWMTDPKIEGPSEANEGGTVTFKCSSQSNTDVTYEWSKDGEFLSSGQVLDRTNVKKSDAGTYKCEAISHRDLVAEHEFKVYIGCVPTIEEPVISGSKNDKDAHHVRITCTASGDPACTMTLTSYQGIQPNYDEENKAILVIPAFKKQMKKPVFSCLASNSVSSGNATKELDDNDLCCTEPVAGGVSTGVIILIIIIVILVVFGIPLGCYLVKKRKTSKSSNGTSKNEKTVDDVEADKLNNPTDEDGL